MPPFSSGRAFEVVHYDAERWRLARPRHGIERFPRIVGAASLTPLTPATLFFTSTKRVHLYEEVDLGATSYEATVVEADLAFLLRALSLEGLRGSPRRAMVRQLTGEVLC
jgi:hypothetical protein